MYYITFKNSPDVQDFSARRESRLVSDTFGSIITVVSDIHERLEYSKRIQKFFKGGVGEIYTMVRGTCACTREKISDPSPHILRIIFFSQEQATEG